MKLTPKAIDRFLAHLRAGGFVTEACELIGVAAPSIYQRKKKDPVFARAWEEAAAIGEDLRLDEVEKEIRRRGIEGTLRPVYYKGKPVGAIKEYSDKLLSLLAMRLSAKYRYRQDVTSAGNEIKGVVVLPHVPGSSSSEDWADQYGELETPTDDDGDASKD